MNIILFGPPGSGKGTIAAALMAKQDFIRLATGDLFRDVLKTSNPLADKINEYINSGKLVTDDLTNELLAHALKKYDQNKHNFIFDGYPRNINQTKFLDGICKIDLVILLKIDDQTIMRRVAGRRICPSCGGVYNIFNGELKDPTICPKDGTKLIQRSDDNDSVNAERIKIYYDAALKQIDFYKSKNILRVIDADRKVEPIINDVLEMLKEN